jgi:hypothetical protein
MDSHRKYALFIRGHSQDKNANKSTGWGGGRYLNPKVDLNP